ncbi:MAG: GDP-mannose 4,6-dehydratase [Thermodesulfobacteriota bacterium]
MKILVTGGAGFVGSHAAEYYAKRDCEVVVFDNLSRKRILGSSGDFSYNWDYLKKYDNIKLVSGDVNNFELLSNLARDVDAIIHTAAQVAVTTSLSDPRTDFEINAVGTFNVLEAARTSKNGPAVLYCSTNKVYGNNVNKIPVKEEETRYSFDDEDFENGIAEDFTIDGTEHTPYGCSKLSGDIYVQDYGHRDEVDTGIFRMSCIYGTRQFGTEDQGWVVHFILSTLMGKSLTIYGDGKQVRDVLFVTDLINVFDKFIENRDRYSGEVFNIGGGARNTLSLLELLDILEELTGKRSSISFDDWRPSDQKVYISDITKVQRLLGWKPRTGVEEGLELVVNWLEENRDFAPLLLKT